jgi:hypothetical protein
MIDITGTNLQRISAAKGDFDQVLVITQLNVRGVE